MTNEEKNPEEKNPNEKNAEKASAEVESPKKGEPSEKPKAPSKKLIMIIAAAVLAIVAITVSVILIAGREHTHLFGEYSALTSPTCTDEGEEVRTCECGESETRRTEALGHLFKNGICERCSAEECAHADTEEVAEKAPTCTDDGFTAGKRCKGCGKTLEGIETVAALGHSYKDGACERCGAPDPDYESTDCTHEILEDISEIAPGCIDGGCTAGKKCTECGKITEGCEPLSALGHSYNGAVCTRCGDRIQGYGLEYTLSSDGTYYTVSGIGTCTDKELTVPSKYNDLPVTAIDDAAFRNNKTLTTVILSDGIERIGEYAFRGCSKLTSVTLGRGVTDTNVFAFYSASALASINVAEGNPAYKSADGILYTADGKTLLRYPENKPVSSFEIPEGVETVGEYAFYGNSKLQSVSFPESLSSINDYAFNYSRNLSDAVIPDGVTKIGAYAFSDCRRLKSADIGRGITVISEGAFKSNTYLEAVRIGESVEKIGAHAFESCNISSLTIPDSVKEICDFAFSYAKLYSVKLGSGLKILGENAFDSCDFTEIELPNGLIEIKPYAFTWCNDLVSISIPDSVTKLDGAVFKYCDSLKSISIGNGVTELYGSLCEACYALTDVKIGNNVKRIAASIFDGVSDIRYNEYGSCLYLGNDDNPYLVLMGPKSKDITSCTVHEDTVVIKGAAFSGCGALSSITLPEGIAGVGSEAFRDCTALTSVSLGSVASYIGNHAFYNCKELKSVTLGSVKTIETQAFYNCKKLSGVVIPDCTEIIEDYAFESCESLGGIKLPDSVTYVGNYAFNNCKLTDITLSSKLTYIGSSAFTMSYEYTFAEYGGCRYLGTKDNPYFALLNPRYQDTKSCTVHKDTKIIPYGAFVGYMNLSLSEIKVDDGNTEFKSIDGNLYSKDGKTLIRYAPAKTAKSFTLADGVLYVGARAFSDCKSLENVTLPESLERIGEYAFADSGALKSVVMGRGVKEIGGYVFSGSSKFKKLYYTGTKEEFNLITVGGGNHTVIATVEYDYIR